MSEYFLGQLMLFPFGYAPVGWMACNGQTLSISQYSALYSLIGVTFGGDGVTNFKLPNLAGATPIMASGTAYPRGAAGGEATHILTINEVPAHTHTLQATSNTASTGVPTINMLAKPAISTYAPASGAPAQTMQNGTLQPNGGGQPHENRTPYTVMNWCIALTGLFPSRG